jgi:hypothetical protein
MTEWIEANQRIGMTYNLVILVRESLDGGKLVGALEGNGKLFARGTEGAVIDDIVTSRWARHCDDLSR